MAVPAGVDSTFEQLWKRLLVHAPELPMALAQEYINTAYSRVLRATRWSSLRKDGEFFINNPYATGTISITTGSTIVTGVGTNWTTAFNNSTPVTGAQLTVQSIAPVYDIISVQSDTQLTIDRPYANVNVVNESYSIDNMYLPCPSDFVGFESVRDILNNWRLHTDNFLQKQLDIWDPMRSISGTPWIMVPCQYDSFGNRRYEIWPRASSTRLYPFRYIRTPPLLVNLTDTPIFPVSGEVIREGALSELALYKGTNASPNPYFDINLHMAHEKRFWEQIAALINQDQDIQQTRVQYEDLNSVPYAPIDARYLQTHDTPF